MNRLREKSELALVGVILLAGILLNPLPAFAGRIVAWGWNYDGQCNVPSGSDFAAISANWKHSLALKADGSIVGWGQNNHGQSNSPAGNDFVAISAGEVHSLALKADGSLVAWGYNGNGECKVPSGNNFVAIAAGTDHNLALRRDGSIVAWGSNGDGQCNAPSGTNFVGIAAGFKWSLATRSDGSLVAWGKMTEPMLGYDLHPPLGHDFMGVAAGGFMYCHGVAVRYNGSLVAWGSNNYGQCNAPAGNHFVAVAAGATHSLAIKVSGSVVAWGRNDQGQCDVPPLKDCIAVAAGSSHSLALIKEPTAGIPIADAGNNLVASANEEVTLDGSNSTDLDGKIILYTWKRLPDEVVIYSGQEPTCRTRALGRAEEVIELTVTDNTALTASDTVVIVNRMLKNLQDLLGAMNLGDLNEDRNVDMVDLALFAENWLK